MYRIFDGAFNITNVCNLTCSGCESFNNFNFRNHFRFDDYKDLYKRWSEIVSINVITLHGGEPFTNPDIVNWAAGLKHLWPNANKPYVSTNGSLLKNHIETAKQLLDLGWYIDVSIHDTNLTKDIENSIKEVLNEKPYKIVNFEDEIRYVAHNSNRPYFILYQTTDFISSAKKGVKNNKWQFHRSNSTLAHKVCLGGEPPCTHFNKGLMYQCHLTSVSADLIKQFPLEDHAIDLLQQYKPAHPDDDLSEFFETLHKPMPQCELCPESTKTHCIAPLAKKKETGWI
jgi:organic radical activating enzyme